MGWIQLVFKHDPSFIDDFKPLHINLTDDLDLFDNKN